MILSIRLSRYFLVGLVCSLFFVGACSSSKKTDVPDTLQTIQFSDFQFQAPSYFEQGDVGDWVDQRIVSKINAVFSAIDVGSGYTDNIVISHDKLDPSADLIDYVQSSLGGIASTWGNYTLLGSQQTSFSCNALIIPNIISSFSIYRIQPTTQSAETVYFVQSILHSGPDVWIVSASTGEKNNLKAFQTMINSITCNYRGKS